MTWLVRVCLFRDRIVLDPSDVIGSCGLFVARDFRTLIHRHRRTSLVEVAIDSRANGVGARAKTPAIGGDVSLLRVLQCDERMWRFDVAITRRLRVFARREPKHAGEGEYDSALFDAAATFAGARD